MVRALQLLAGVGRLLTDSAQDARVPAAARYLAESFADVCLVEALHGQQLRTLAACHRHSQWDEDLRDALDNRSLGGTRALLSLLRAGVPERCDRDMPEHLASVGVRSAVFVPLLVDQRPVGLLTLGWQEAGYDLGPQEWLSIEDIARRLGAAVQVSETLEHDVKQMARLLAAGDQLAAAPDLETALGTAGEFLIPAVTDCCAVFLTGNDGEVSLAAVVHRDPAQADRVRADLKSQLPELTRAGGAFGRFRRTGHWADLTVTGRTASLIPLSALQQDVGALLVFNPPADRPAAPFDQRLIGDFAGRLAVVLLALIRDRAARRSAAARDTFLAVAAHELKTPITNLRGYAQFLLRRLNREGALNPEQLRQTIEIFDQQSEKLTRLVLQLLDVSQIESGQMGLELQVADLRLLLDNIINLHQTMYPDRGVQVRAPNRVPVLLDPLRIEQVVSNLLENAARYSPAGSEIVLDVWQPNPDEVYLAVSDRGSGIVPERRDGLFKRYYQAHDQSHLTGLGLGLYICREIVARHGGRIWAEFPPEGGTRVVVCLPVGLGAPDVARQAADS